jgi:hypothetical protein
MPRPAIKFDCVNFDRPGVKERLKARIDRLEGEYRGELAPTRLTRSQKANRKYFAGWVTPFAVYLLEQGSARTMAEAKELAHEEIVIANLGEDTYVSPVTGEVRKRPKPTHTLTFDEFSRFMALAEVWLTEMGVAVDDWEGDNAAMRTEVARAS